VALAAFTGAFAVCVLATCLTPYHLRIYIPVVTAVRLTDPFLFLAELQAPPFRLIFDWIMLSLLLAAAFVLGRQRTVSWFLVLLLATGAFVAFRARRDVWFVVIASAATLAITRATASKRLSFGMARVAVIAVLVLGVTVGLSLTRVSASRLEEAVAEAFPVGAAAFVDRQQYRGRIYNDYNWGGYLMWRLPVLDVSLDGRNPLHGDDRIWQSIRTWGGHPSWASDPELARASIVIADVNTALASLLRLDRRFALVYEDRVAAVFVQPVTSPPASTISR